MPHENGAILSAALTHILTPRVLYHDKPNLPSDSAKVRRYAGVWVAGDRQHTSIAFGYVGESYVDFGVPGMFVPIFLFGLVVGLVLFILARVFRHGAAMREDLEGTV
jgi:hypothetical protein